MEKISLVVTALNPNEFKLNRMLQSAVGFDQIYFHLDKNSKSCPTVPFIDGINLEVINYPEHLDIGEAYNRMISGIDSEWFCCFPDDDFFDPKDLKALLDDIRAGKYADADVIHFKVHVSGIAPYHTWGGVKVKQEMIEAQNWFPAGSFFRKSVWEKVGGFRGDLYHDWIFWLRAMKSGARFKFAEQVPYWFMMRKDSAAVRQTLNMTPEQARERVLSYANE